jgi:hypothetical protein
MAPDSKGTTMTRVNSTRNVQPKSFYLKGLVGKSIREFMVTPTESHTGSSNRSFQISETIDGKLVIHGYTLSYPAFEDARRVVEQTASPKPVTTNTYSNRKSKFKEKKMAVRKKATPSTVQKVKELGAMAERHMAKARGRPISLIVVQAKDGKWVYGPGDQETKLAAMKKGEYDSAADASEAASKSGDIIINTGPAPTRTKKPDSWGLGTKPPSPDTVKATPDREKTPKTKAEKASGLADGVALKKVCAEANVDPKLARRILRSKGAKPGGRWEWPKGEVAAIVKLLKEGAAAEAKKQGEKK